MLRELPAPIRGCTHVNLTEAHFDLGTTSAYVRGTLGTVDGLGVYSPDTDLKQCYVDWQGAEFAALAATLDGTAVIAAAQAKNWNFSSESE